MNEPGPGKEYADPSLLHWYMGELLATAKRGEVTWLSEEGQVVGGVASVEVIEAGLRALGRVDQKRPKLAVVPEPSESD